MVHADWPPVGFVELQTPSQLTIAQRFTVAQETSLSPFWVSRTDEVHVGLAAAGFVEVKTMSPRTPTQSDCDGHEIAPAPSPPRSVACQALALPVGVVDVHTMDPGEVAAQNEAEGQETSVSSVDSVAPEFHVGEADVGLPDV
jgi:hypothetical protein